MTPLRAMYIPSVTLGDVSGWWDAWPMADSGALRQARYKAHRAGDHHLCKHLRDLPARPTVPDLDPDDLDPVAEMRALAGRLVQACSEDRGNPSLARELRNTLVVLAGMVPDDGDDELARLLSEPVRGTGQDYSG
jgi:hypothetical protein